MTGLSEPVDILPVVVSLVPAAGLFFMQVIHLRPNRIAEGQGYSLWELSLPILPVVLLVLAAGVLVVSARMVPQVEIPALLLWAVSIGVVPWILFHMAAVELSERGELGELARVSPGAAVWIALVAALAAWHELLRSSRGRAKTLFVGALLIVVGFVVFQLVSEPMERLSYVVEYNVRADRFLQELMNHIRLSGSAVGLACLIGVPAGMAAYRHTRFRDAILDVTSTIQTIPSLAMFGLLIAPLAALSQASPVLRSLGVSGVGATPALIALTLYALLPVVRNTLTGLSVVPRSVRESGQAMGMTRRQRFWMVEMPLALPVLIRGIRTAAVQAVGNTTVAGLIGAGGLGWFIFQGLGQAATDLVVLGVIPIVLLAIVVDRVFQLLQQLAVRGGGEVKEAK
jgi:osmoprotectant transport system permease protein